MQNVTITNIVNNNINTQNVQVDADITKLNGQIPLSEEDINKIIEAKENTLDSRITVLLYVDKENYLRDYAKSLLDPNDLWDHYDLAHDLAFAVGNPLEPSIRILGANDYDFLIEYSSLFPAKLF